MVPFASVEDYRATWPTDEATDETLTARLTQATALMCREMELGGVEYSDPSQPFSEALRAVCIAMVRRTRASSEAPGGAEIPFGATQFSQTAGSYTHSATLANPLGDMRLMPSERRLLGIGRGRAYAMCSLGDG